MFIANKVLSTNRVLIVNKIGGIKGNNKLIKKLVRSKFRKL